MKIRAHLFVLFKSIDLSKSLAFFMYEYTEGTKDRDRAFAS